MAVKTLSTTQSAGRTEYRLRSEVDMQGVSGLRLEVKPLAEAEGTLVLNDLGISPAASPQKLPMLEQ